MVVTGARISGVADVRDYLSLLYDSSFGEALCVMREVRVVEDHFLIGADLIDRRATAFALEELLNLAVSSGKDGSFGRSGNVDRIVNAALGARGVEGIDQLFRPDTGDGNNKIRSSH